MRVCEQCPFSMMIKVAEELVDSTDHLSADKALGGIAITKDCLNRIAAVLECPEPFQSTMSGQMDCPLRETVNGARSFAFAPWSQSSFEVVLESMSPHKKIHTGNTGQYL